MNRRAFLAAGAMTCAFAAALPRLARAAAPTRFSVTVTGSGPDVILVPGLGSSSAVWEGTVRRLSATHRVHAVQIAGFAGTPPMANAEGEFLPGVVAELASYIAAETRSPPAYAGHSLGGLIGQLIAIEHPRALSRLMIVDSLPFFGMLYGPMMTVDILRPQAAQMRDQQFAMSPEAWAQNMDMVAAQQVAHGDRATVASWGRNSDRGVFTRAMFAALSTDTRPRLASIATPTTIVYPRNLDADPQDRSGQLYRAAYAPVAQVAFVPIDDAAHFVMLDQPEKFEDAVAAWLAP